MRQLSLAITAIIGCVALLGGIARGQAFGPGTNVTGLNVKEVIAEGQTELKYQGRGEWLLFRGGKSVMKFGNEHRDEWSVYLTGPDDIALQLDLYQKEILINRRPVVRIVDASDRAKSISREPSQATPKQTYRVTIALDRMKIANAGDGMSDPGELYWNFSVRYPTIDGGGLVATLSERLRNQAITLASGTEKSFTELDPNPQRLVATFEAPLGGEIVVSGRIDEEDDLFRGGDDHIGSFSERLKVPVDVTVVNKSIEKRLLENAADPGDITVSFKVQMTPINAPKPQPHVPTPSPRPPAPSVTGLTVREIHTPQGGTFQDQGNGKWMEKNSTGIFHFTEISRSIQKVSLLKSDGARLELRIGENKVYLLSNSNASRQVWSPIYEISSKSNQVGRPISPLPLPGPSVDPEPTPFNVVGNWVREANSETTPGSLGSPPQTFFTPRTSYTIRKSGDELILISADTPKFERRYLPVEGKPKTYRISRTKTPNGQFIKHREELTIEFLGANRAIETKPAVYDFLSQKTIPAQQIQWWRQGTKD